MQLNERCVGVCYENYKLFKRRVNSFQRLFLTRNMVLNVNNKPTNGVDKNNLC